MKNQHIQNFLKYLSVGIIVTLLNIFFSWIFIDVIGIRAIISSTIVGFSIFFIKYHSYTRINLIKKKFHLFLCVNLSSVLLYILSTAIMIDMFKIPTLISIPFVVVSLFLLRFFAFYWIGIIKSEQHSKDVIKEVWQVNKEKHLSKNPLVKHANRKLKKDILKVLKNLEVKTILDIGCGEGFITREIGKKFPKVKIVAVDPQKKYIKYAKKFHKLKNISFKEGDLDSNSLKKKFDLVILTEVLEHLQNPRQALKKIRKLSNKYILLTVPNEPFFRLGNLFALKYVKDLGNSPGHLHNWTKNQLSKFPRELGLNFKIKTSSFWNILLIKIK